MKILIIEDSRADLAVIGEHVRRLGGQPLGAANGLDGVALFEKERPDLVLLDVILPDINGFEVARQCRALERHDEWTPIIFLSAMTRDEDVEQGIAAGGDDYLLKPVSSTVLCAKIRAMQRLIQMRTSLVVLTRKLDAANRELQRQSSIDGLTGIANRRLFDETLGREWRRARRTRSNLALLMCDVDHFKPYNDYYGHQAGDDCLRLVASTLQEQMERASDIVARYGGEEFAIILPETHQGGAHLVAERIRSIIEGRRLPHQAAPAGYITISVGVASLMPEIDNSSDDLLKAADQALYQAKRAGRNRVWLAEPAGTS